MYCKFKVMQVIFYILLRSCFDLFEMFFEVKESSFSSRFFSQIAPLSSLEEAVEPEVFHSHIFKQTNQNSFLETACLTQTILGFRYRLLKRKINKR